MPLTTPTNVPIHVLVTRPVAQAAGFAAQVAARFGDAARVVVSPLMEIVPLPAQVDFGAYDAVVFTSQNGVEAYQALGGPVGLTAYCVGARTAERAGAAGLVPMSADGDLAALNNLLRDQAAGQALLHLSGRHVAGTVEARVTRIEAYDQRPLPLTTEAQTLLRRRTDILVPLFSPNAVRWFEEALPARIEADLYAVCISKTVAERVNLTHFKSIRFMGPPTAEGMLDKMSDFFPVRPA